MNPRKRTILFIVLSFIGISILLCIALVLIAPNVIGTLLFDPQRAEQVARQIANYTLPPEYEEQIGLDFLLVQYVRLNRDSPESTITLVQFRGADTSQAELEKHAELSRHPTQDNSKSMRYVGERTGIIKRQPVALIILEGRDDKSEIRRVETAFPGKDGIVLMTIKGSINDWDWRMLEDFLGSIR